ncbi:MAG: ATP-dependent helicase [Rhodoglobus sp.]
MGSQTLTPEQDEIVHLPPGAWLVTALPGCGKTEVLARRVEHLLQTSGRRRSRILVLTFTARAAQEVTERVRQTLPEHADRAIAQTFHQFAAEVLRQQGPNLQRDLYSDRAERLLALRNALAEEEVGLGAVGLDRLLNEIELAKKTLAFERGEPPDERLRRAFDAYTRYQERERVCDFDDLILDVIGLFRAPSGPVSIYRQLYGSVLVDEAQDLNRSQYELLRSLVAPKADVMLMADDRQSIFSFNGADVGLLEQFERDFSAGRKRLTMSFRCGRRIVVAANLIASKLNRVLPEHLREDIALAEGALEVAEFPDEATEARAVQERIAQLLANGLPAIACHPGERLSLEPQEIAVLGRSRFALAAVEDALRATGRNVVVSYDREDTIGSSIGRSAVLLLRVVSHPSDLVVREQLVRSVTRTASIPPSLSETIGYLASFGDAKLAAMAKIALGGESDSQLVGAVIAALASPTPMDEEEAALCSSDVEWLGRIRGAVRRRVGRDPTPSEFVRELAMPMGGTVAHASGIRILTVHAAKGQEFRVVILVGMSEGTFPSYRATSERELDEERRLAYVAITRASRLLCVMRPRSRLTAAGNAKYTEASRFMMELNGSLHTRLTQS